MMKMVNWKSCLGDGGRQFATTGCGVISLCCSIAISLDSMMGLLRLLRVMSHWLGNESLSFGLSVSGS